MKTIVWRSRIYKFKNVLMAYVNAVPVGYVQVIESQKRVDMRMLLPGLPKGTNNFVFLDSAKEAVETKTQEWFEATKQ